MKITIKPVSNGLIVETENEIKVYVNKNANEGQFAIFDVLKDFGYNAARDGYSEAATYLSTSSGMTRSKQHLHYENWTN